MDKVSFGELNERKKNILNDLANFDAIEQVGGLNSDLLVQRALRKGELNELILREEIDWRQKARVKNELRKGIVTQSFFIKWLMAGEIGNLSRCWRIKVS